ncbi:MAG TPA: PSD1 and planctomycete cytochrome C domain-containing protein [Pirellulales bacterium]|nr:PSD1 and planctomycete cytochrome C domain-containing protein [Pirellulales bacterium]
MACRRLATRLTMAVQYGLVLACSTALSAGARAGESPTFYRGINLNGPALVIDDHEWEAGHARGVVCEDAAFENQSVRLSPATDDARARMIRASRWSPQRKVRIRVSEVPAGAYSIYLYVWEDNDPQTFDIHLAGRLVAKGYNSGNAGHWDRLGPWALDVADGTIELSAAGGHANLSGIEIWRGKLSDKDHPLQLPGALARPATAEDAVALLLARNCLECHNPSDHKGGLDLTRREQALAGGESGPSLKPGDPADSLLVERVTAGEMPPKGRRKLSDAQRDLLRDWVKAGAKWAADPIDPFLYTSDRRAGYNWWSLQPLSDVEPPPVADASWPVNPIDQFILHRLEQAGLRPSPQADRRALIRRLSFDLVGLPPTPEEVGAFVDDPDPRAYDRLVDRLLDSPHYGERWARRWLDIVRYGESQGFERNKLRPNAWKYRDFVVEAFNADLPYDDFVRWQIAGDVLRPDDPLAVIASGFLVMGPYDLTAYNNGTPDMRAFAREEELEGLVATVCQTFLGLTVNCSRCHDHKFDPITQKEFYQLSAALGGTFQGGEREGLTEAGRLAAETRIAALQTEMGQLAERERTADSQQKSAFASQRSRKESVVRLLKGGPAHVTLPKQPQAWHVLARGDFRQPAEVVQPRGIACVPGVSPDWGLADNAPETDRRKALAEWITGSGNPLLPRVIVNRLWGDHFGEGLVRTPSDFGFQGGLPSHPELLDWLAGQLVHPLDGRPWSLKRVQRLIVKSAAYRQSSCPDPAGMQADADNRLIWRQTLKRLDAETFRDAVLAIAGELDLRLGGPGYRDFKVSSAGDNETYTVFDAVGPDFNRRSLYRTCVRSGTSPLLDVLDCPDPSVATPRRSATNTPLQALTLLNDVFVEHSAGKFAERLAREAPDNRSFQVRRAFAMALARAPTDEEAAFGERFVVEHDLSQFCVVLFNTNEFMFVD